MSRDVGAEEDDLEELRRLGRELGMPQEIRPEDHGIELESAADFVARMRSKEGAAETEPVRIAQRRRGPDRRIVVRGLVAAAAIVVLAGVIIASPWNQPMATAVAPPILDYQFAKATDIAFAPGKDARPDLLALAAAAGHAPDSPRAGGAVQYVQTDNWFASLEDDGGTVTTQVIPTIVETWTAPDGAQTVIESPGPPLGSSGRGLTIGSRSTVATEDEMFPAGNADADAVNALGDTPAAVRKSLIRSGECETGAAPTVFAQCLYQEIAVLYSQNVVPSAAAALLWTVLADEPGFRSLGTVSDRAGRPGVGISVISEDRPEFRSILIISRSTGQLLGQEEILIKSDPDLGLKAPAVNAFTAILTSEYTRDRPRGR